MELPLLRWMAHLPFGHRFGTPRGSGGLRGRVPGRGGNSVAEPLLDR